MALTHQDWQTHLMLVDHTANWCVGDSSKTVGVTKVLAAVFVVQTVTATATVRTRICR